MFGQTVYAHEFGRAAADELPVKPDIVLREDAPAFHALVLAAAAHSFTIFARNILQPCFGTKMLM